MIGPSPSIFLSCSATTPLGSIYIPCPSWVSTGDWLWSGQPHLLLLHTGPGILTTRTSSFPLTTLPPQTPSNMGRGMTSFFFFFKVPRSVFSKDLGAVCMMEAVAPGPGDCLTWEGGGREDCSDFCLGQQDTRKHVHGDGGCRMGSKFEAKQMSFF